MAVGALLCGIFWEMWNMFSLAKWAYHVPWVHRFQVFEMPILGYAGYLPFGIECAVIADFIKIGKKAQDGEALYSEPPLSRNASLPKRS